MNCFPQKFKFPKALGFLFLLTLFSCAGRSTTNTNIKKISDSLLETKDPKNNPVEKTPEVPKTSEQQNGPVPMSTYMSAPTKNTIKTSNRWFSRVQSWAKFYREIAKQEQDVRNYSLSLKYSNLALLWADRSLEIQNFTDEKAIIKIQIWVSQIKLPKLSDEPTYFLGHDAFDKISETRKIMDGLKQRFCLISEGVQFIPALAILDVSIDLLNQKKYTKALGKIQNGFSMVENIEKEKTRCEPDIFVAPK